jgi:hypothetical protein
VRAVDSGSLTSRVREAVLQVDPTQPPTSVSTVRARVDRTFAQRRFRTTLIAPFAVAALILAAAGTCGTVSHPVARRVRELGIRVALGAARPGVVGLVVRRGIRQAVLLRRHDVAGHAPWVGRQAPRSRPTGQSSRSGHS